MIFVTGPLFSGKQAYIQNKLNLSDSDFGQCAIRDVQALASSSSDLDALADKLSNYQIVIATEVGGGVVPIDPKERAAREAAGRLACLLSQRAEVVIRVCCGLPQMLKGELPPCWFI